MHTAEMRERLYDLIRDADDAAIKALYHLLKGTMTENARWWKDTVFVNKLDQQMNGFTTGKENGYSWNAVKADKADHGPDK